MKIAFTICSNNYLAQAKTLGDSLLKYNPDYRLFICLIDKLNPEIDYSFFQPHSILPIEDIGLKDFKSLYEKYNIIELNTCVKASVFKFIFDKYPATPFVFYLDPDILINFSFQQVELEFDSNNILLTPHILNPIPLDNKLPQENTFLNFGIYNLGFLGLKNTGIEVIGFLDWWEERTFTLGYDNVEKGLFVDQLWMNFTPIFFEKVKILKELGYNVAPWNLHERNIQKKTNIFCMKDGSPLYFFHFSSYNYKWPHIISNKLDRSTFLNNPNVRELYEYYHGLIIENKINELSKIKCAYISVKPIKIADRIKKMMIKLIKRILK